MGLKVKNNAYSTLASGITNVATSISVQAGHGTRFPTLGAGDYFYATLIDTSNNLEVVKCTARATDTLTVTRGQDSTTARAYVSGDRIEMRWNAAIIDALPTRTMATADIDDAAITYAKVATAAIATVAEYRAKTASNLLDMTVWDSGALVTLTDAATVAVDLGTGINFSLTLAGNRTLGQPSNASKVGQCGFIKILQDATGSRTLAYHADWEFAGGTVPTLTTTANAKDLLFYEILGTNSIYGSLVKNVS